MTGTDPRPPAEDEAMLLAFVRGRDVECPMCGYNLRDLTTAVCPECRQDLALTVGVRKVLLVPLLATVAPGFFSGISACLLAIPMIRFGPAPWPVFVVQAFGVTSGAATIWLVCRRHTFLRLAPRAQWSWAAAVWGVHVAAFGLLVWLTP